MDDDQKHAADFQLLAISCARTYGAIAFGGLIFLNGCAMLAGKDGLFALSAILAVLGAAFAYANFTAAAGDAPPWTVHLTMAMSIMAGVASGLLFLLHA